MRNQPAVNAVAFADGLFSYPSMTVAPFDVCGPLPRGVTVLEASAGTGKTFAIAALTARYVADGVPLERMLLVTFTRMATGELRAHGGGSGGVGDGDGTPPRARKGGGAVRAGPSTPGAGSCAGTEGARTHFRTPAPSRLRQISCTVVLVNEN